MTAIQASKASTRREKTSSLSFSACFARNIAFPPPEMISCVRKASRIHINASLSFFMSV